MSIEKILKLDTNEQIIQRIKRHPFGSVVIYASGFIGVILALYILFIAVRSETTYLNLSDGAYGLIVGLIILLLAIFTYIGVHVYNTNELVVTNENIIQVLQFSLLSKQTSQLNLAKIQDISVDQNGIFSNTLNYGTIEIETAGEAANFRFTYAPNPNRVAKIIVEAYEDYVSTHPSGHHTFRV